MNTGEIQSLPRVNKLFKKKKKKKRQRPPCGGWGVGGGGGWGGLCSSVLYASESTLLPLTLKIDRAAWAFLKFDMRHVAYG